MEVQQFYDEGLAHASYAVLSNGEVAIIDPARNPEPYEKWMAEKGAKLVAILETHPHADFASSHLELSKKYDAPVYVNSKMGVFYEHVAFDDGDVLELGKVKIKAIFTPGHSPDHNTYLLIDEEGKNQGLFTGDSLFIGDVGRPDLREGAGNFNLPREELAGQMYDTMQNIFQKFEDHVMVYPAHGAGSSCGKNMVKGETISTMGKERQRNWALKENDREAFVNELLSDQPAVPKYFPYSVELNRKGAQGFNEAVKNVTRLNEEDKLDSKMLVIDTRPAADFRNGHRKGAINIPDGGSFENWLGTLIAPDEYFYLLAADDSALDEVIRKAAKIGYEGFIKGALVYRGKEEQNHQLADAEQVKQHPREFTILDVRNKSEVEQKKPFETSINIPLTQLRERLEEVPTSKPVAVHCAAGYRSAVASSILKAHYGNKIVVQDISEAIKGYL